MANPATTHPSVHRGTGAQWVDRRELEQLARASTLRAGGSNVRLAWDAGGVTITVEPLVWLRISTCVAYNHYTGGVWDALFEDDGTPITTPTVDSATIYVPFIATTEQLRVGSYIMGLRKGSHYEAIPPVFL